MKVEICEALLHRAVMQESERELVKDLLWRAARGLEGEHKADRFWADLAVKIPHLLFHNYETKKAEHFTHQMDSVFICGRFVLIMELKHIAGEISYDDTSHQLLRVINGQKLALGDPFSQLMRHEAWMQQFLVKIGVELPVLSAVIVTTSSSILGPMPERFRMFKLPGLRIKLHDWFRGYPVCINTHMLQYIKDEMMLRYEPQKWRHPVRDLKIRPGVLCDCGASMHYQRGQWHCLCGEVARNHFARALHDYRLLVSEWITNQAFRAFFGIESADTVNKILRRAGFESEGYNKTKRYLIPDDIWRINR